MFILQLSAESMNRYNTLDAFTQGYLSAAFWTLSDDASEELKTAKVENLSEEAWQEIIETCQAFQKSEKASLDLAYDYCPEPYEPRNAGVDLWLTRNGNGSGYWSRGFGKAGASGTVGDYLTKAAEALNGRALYFGDDRKLYFSEA